MDRCSPADAVEDNRAAVPVDGHAERHGGAGDPGEPVAGGIDLLRPAPAGAVELHHVPANIDGPAEGFGRTGNAFQAAAVLVDPGRRPQRSGPALLFVVAVPIAAAASFEAPSWAKKP